MTLPHGGEASDHARHYNMRGKRGILNLQIPFGKKHPYIAHSTADNLFAVGQRRASLRQKHAGIVWDVIDVGILVPHLIRLWLHLFCNYAVAR